MVVVVVVAQVAVAPIKAAPQWVKWICRAQVPLAHNARAVARLAQVFGQQRFGQGQAYALVVGRVGYVDIQAETGGVAPGEQAGAGWGAYGAGDVAVGE